MAFLTKSFGWLLPVLLCLAVVAGCGRKSSPPPAPAAVPARLVALSPSCVELLCALGQGNRLVGIDSYTKYPPEICDRPRLGALLDANYEAIVGLKPDLVALPTSHDAGRRKLSSLGVACLPVVHDSVAGVIASARTAGQACGVPERGESLARELETAWKTAQTRPAATPRPRVLLCLSRDYAAAELREMYAAGGDGFYHVLLEAAGASNVCATGPIKFPKLSRENLLALDPDIIIEVVTGTDKPAAEIAKTWSTLADLKAVKNGRIHVLTADYTTIPGPRFPLLLADFERIVRPVIVNAGVGIQNSESRIQKPEAERSPIPNPQSPITEAVHGVH
jgi:iron complex transport system substrate-binding protein